MINKNPYPIVIPSRLSKKVIGRRLNQINMNGTGIKKIVTNLETSIDSRSDLIVTIKAEKKIK